jgi:predicted CXXCH cytochrome family protein
MAIIGRAARGPVREGITLTRRRLLQALAAAGVVALQPRLLGRVIAAGAPSSALPPYGFLTADELAILDAVTALILPSDERPGAREIGVVDYVQSLLSFMPGSDANCDRLVTVADLTAVEVEALGSFLGCPDGGDVNGDGTVDGADVRAAEAASFRARPPFAGGPFSGRNPQPHFPIGNTPCADCHAAHATANPAVVAVRASTVDVYPPNAFREFLPLNRLQKLSWKVRILGADAVPEVADNPLIVELPEVDLRRRYREGLAALEASSQQQHAMRFVELPTETQQQLLRQAAPQFVELLRRHVIQGTFSVPEYGGNRDQLGWQLTGIDGDSQPLGYEIYDESVPGFYRERPDKPNSGPNPDEDCAGFSAPMQRFLKLISSAAGGGQFPEPYCFEVDR